ncbi:ABC transporter permease [Roseovarius salinarum]|uniref:ABC transporter permease n=1 Tax=Roseovarius salinarum TaxID=1981892 RepID=UPI000C329495|nr:ABC transporter permease [Roseovarius salinarum]
MTLFGVALRNLSGWQPRNLGALAGITIAVASFVALVGLARGVEHSLLSTLVDRGTDLMVTEAGALDLVSSIVPDARAEDIDEIEGVTRTAPELSRLTSLDDGRSVGVVGWPVGSFPWESLTVVEGRLPAGPDRREVAVGEALAERAGFAMGDEVWLFQTRFEITGVVTAPTVLARSLAYVPLTQAQALTFRDGQATVINVRTDPDRPDEVAGRIRERFPDLAVERAETLASDFMFARIAAVLAYAISTVALVSAGLVIFTAMSTAVAARRGEIAILSAIGWARWRIVSALLIEGTVIAMVAGVAGAAAGVLAAEAVAARPDISGFVAPRIGAALLAQGVGLSLAVGIVGSLLPALSVTRRPPAEVLRGK